MCVCVFVHVCLYIMMCLFMCAVVNYEDTVRTSLQEVEDLLGSFDLPSLAQPPAPAKTTPTKTTPTRHAPGPSGGPKRSSSKECFQELEVTLYDSDSLPSPPSSENSSEADEKELDKLLDFSKDDEFSYNPGPTPAKVRDYTQEGLEGPRMMKATLQAKHGLEVCMYV